MGYLFICGMWDHFVGAKEKESLLPLLETDTRKKQPGSIIHTSSIVGGLELCFPQLFRKST